MAYNKYGDAVSDIITYKKWYADADAAGDEAGKNNAASLAKGAYDYLNQNGYRDAAKILGNSDYEAAKKWAKTDKTAIRPYLYSSGQQLGLSNADMDKIIGWDNDTGQFSIGGKTVGTPDVVIDGVSYVSDTSALDKVLNDYVKRSGVTVPNGVDNKAYSQSMSAATDKNAQYWDSIKGDRQYVQGKYDNILKYADQDVTKTDEYKSAFENIMPSYNLKAMQGRDNVVAGNAGSNGGNIDSFSAANAMKQQMTINAQGQALAHQMGLDSYNARINNVRGLLSDLGVYNQGTYANMKDNISDDFMAAQTYFENEQNAKNNEVARLSEKANVTGYVPEEWSWKEDPFYKEYLDNNGNLKEQYMNGDIDFQAIINNLKAKGDPASLELANKFAVLRGKKISQDLKNYGEFAKEGDISYLSPQKTANYDTAIKGIESAETMNTQNLNAAEKQILLQYLLQNASAGGGAAYSSDPLYGLIYGKNGANNNNNVLNAALTSALASAFGIDVDAINAQSNDTASANNNTASPYVHPFTTAGTVYLNGEENYNNSRGNTGNTGSTGNTTSGTTGNNTTSGTSGTPSSETDMSDYTIGNSHSDDWVLVSGLGRLTYQELESMVNRGAVKEVIDNANKKITYRKA